MAGQLSKEKLESVLMQAMMARNNLRPQRDRLLQLQRRLQQLGPGDGDADRMKELASDLVDVYFIGIEAGSRMLATCIELAAKNGARLAISLAFAAMPDEQLHDALLAQRLPARPTTQTEAFSRVEATFNAVKVAQDHHIPRCIEHLVGERPPTVFAAIGDHAETDLSDPAPPADATGEPPQEASSRVDLDKARDYLDRACTLMSLAVKHIDLAVVVLSSFLDPKKVASLSEFTGRRVYISEDGPYPSD